jgi:Kef-type K+ transport system membrane component KefB
MILVCAKVGGHIATRFGQPAVLGELLAGVVLGNVSLLGFHGFEAMRDDVFLDMFARVGVIVLLFEVGLESTVAQMLKVGWSALWVACIGVVTPVCLGFAVASWLLPDQSVHVHLFIGATLTATSVGITARVLRDVNRSQTDEARVILGAAVIDDVLGLIILAVVTGMIAAESTGAHVGVGAVAIISLKSVSFLAGALVAGRWLAPKLFTWASRLRANMVLLAISLGFCFTLAWGADAIGLAPIVGAFAAGLILEEVQYRTLLNQEAHSLEEMIHPISALLVPVFFVTMGMKTDLSSLGEGEALVLSAVLCVVAIAGKVVSGLGASGRGLNRLAIGLGMMPRGEVGLIFAGTTVAGARVLSPPVFAAMVVMVLVTTVVTPPLLTWSLGKGARSQ